MTKKFKRVLGKLVNGKTVTISKNGKSFYITVEKNYFDTQIHEWKNESHEIIEKFATEEAARGKFEEVCEEVKNKR